MYPAPKLERAAPRRAAGCVHRRQLIHIEHRRRLLLTCRDPSDSRDARCRAALAKRLDQQIPEVGAAQLRRDPPEQHRNGRLLVVEGCARVELRGHPKQGAHIDERRVDRGQLGEGARNHEREHGILAVRGLEIEVALRDLPVTGVVMHCDRQALAQEHLHVVGRGMIALVVAEQESTCAREVCQGEPFGCRSVDREAEQSREQRAPLRRCPSRGL